MDNTLKLFKLFALDTIVTSLLTHLRIKVLFPKIIQLELPSTKKLFLAILDHLRKLTITEHLAFNRRILISKIHGLICSPITSLIKQYAFCWLSVSACSSTLLIVVLKGFWERIMDNKSHVWFVDTHSKCNCCDDDLDFILHPHLLNLTPVIVMQISMIKRRAVRFGIQLLAYFFTLFFAYAINDSWFILVLLQYLTDFLNCTSFRFLPYFVHKVRTIETWLEEVTFFEFKLFYDFLLYCFCNCSSQP